ncbi:SDR family oxidoreductase [Halomarina rubra]|uniref:SDR family oxidoreductase n=1 Tax=Halomarina rubra TaxID=2071873 RepID=A0ABD6AXB2_9EURY|nr:SDR family oxidoreductase [Halomarina rubra]
MDNLLDGKSAVVTGGSSGIGRGISLAFANHGADVVVADLQESPREGGTPTHEQINAETDGAASYVECDVTSQEDLEAAVDAAEEFGGIDVMVNNAGIFRTNDFLETTESEYDQVMEINAKGVFFSAQAAAKRMVENGGGSIINMSSLAGYLGNATYPVYNMSKAGVRMLTYSLADKLGPEGIRVNAIHPGSIQTALSEQDMPGMDDDVAEQFVQMVPQRRSGTPEDVAGVAVFLASDLAGYVSAESILVDGGYANTG